MSTLEQPVKLSEIAVNQVRRALLLYQVAGFVPLPQNVHLRIARQALGERSLPGLHKSCTLRTVGYDPFIESQLASRN